MQSVLSVRHSVRLFSLNKVTFDLYISGYMCHKHIVIGRLGHATVNLPTKFEVSTFSRYGDMKCVKNAQNGGGLG